MKSIALKKSRSRVAFDCVVQGFPMEIIVDSGSPNTLVPSDFAERTGLQRTSGVTFKGKILGYEFTDRYAIMLPEIKIPYYRSLYNVRVIAALDGEEFAQTILLGMNVLNHGTTIIRRENDTGTFDFYESPASNVKGSTRHRFNHLLVDGNYLISDTDTDEICNEAFKMFTENNKNGEWM